MFVSLSPNLTCLALSSGQFSCRKCTCVSRVHELPRVYRGKPRPLVFCAILWPGWYTLSRVKNDFGLMVCFCDGWKTWLGKCVVRDNVPHQSGAICGVCNSQTSPGARGQSCTQSLNNKVVVVFPWVSVWSFPELLSEVSLPLVSHFLLFFSVRNSVREQYPSSLASCWNGQEDEILTITQRKTGPSDSLWQGSRNWPLWWWMVGRLRGHPVGKETA